MPGGQGSLLGWPCSGRMAPKAGSAGPSWLLSFSQILATASPFWGPTLTSQPQASAGSARISLRHQEPREGRSGEALAPWDGREGQGQGLRRPGPPGGAGFLGSGFGGQNRRARDGRLRGPLGSTPHQLGGRRARDRRAIPDSGPQRGALAPSGARGRDCRALPGPAAGGTRTVHVPAGPTGVPGPARRAHGREVTPGDRTAAWAWP